ncbi:PIN2/TERF1-interacting telomerase inhibitor 1 isoform X2 [Boleophthalmus pectinirostris]|uniref:PIN2/TERF1-interacting telomerase inhibitor 1 isoform X2 n=1 Tax=Boleophthalmus pectinirostris TaxID=150288 RepID=UPI00242C71B7|nr:PIN2/TERF1-interacting telomerase inhibitor 1 isoform X2 [Boleophthalmus pectinirostris]
MSMLAEPRRKQKWSVDPRNSAWSKDDNKFGQKMLERMGWSKGKGLGRTEQGATEHIKVRVKNDSYGLGANASHEDNWIAHQDDFNELLAQLNSCHGQNNESPPEEQKGFSLEEKSKTARKRVHYMKFTKGKDLSSRSEKDLNCIFGKRGPSKEQDQESNSSESQDEKEQATVIAPTELDTESITNTVTSSLTMQEYFAQRMARLKKVQALSSDVNESSGENSPTHDTNNCSAEQPKKKKKKKDKKAADEAEVSEEKCDAPVSEEHKEPEQRNPEKKKNKKRKMHENERPLTLEEEMPSSKEKKKKKHKDETEEINGHLLAEDDNLQSEVNKVQNHDQVESVFAKKKSKKDKKSKRRKQSDTME